MTEETIGIGSRLGGFQIESELGRGSQFSLFLPTETPACAEKC